jgi:hypothetical protein
MKTTSIILILTAILISSCSDSSQSAKNGDSDLVKIENLFREYNDATIKSDGQHIYELIDEETIRYYKGLLDKVRTYDSLMITQSSISDQINILSARAVINDSILMNLDAQSFIVMMFTAVNTVDQEKEKVLRNMMINNVVISGKYAKGDLASNGIPVEPKLTVSFTKEGEDWKYNTLSTFLFTNNAIQSMLEQSGLSNLDYINLVFSDPSVQSKLIKPLDEVWNSQLIKETL